jgi:predicted nucleic acid-binding protein
LNGASWMSEQPYFLDVNIPMYAAGQDHPHKAASVWILSEIAEGRLKVVIDAEIIQEILYRYGAIGMPQVGAVMATNLLELVPDVLPITVSDVRLAVTLFAQYAARGVKARDVLHAAIMQNHQLTHIISTDRHFDQVEGLQRVDPGTMHNNR